MKFKDVRIGGFFATEPGYYSTLYRKIPPITDNFGFTFNATYDVYVSESKPKIKRPVYINPEDEVYTM